MYMIIADQMSVSDTLLAGRRASSVSRRRRAGYQYHLHDTDKRQTFLPTSVDDSRDRESLFSHRHRLPYQLVPHARNAAAIDRRALPGQAHHNEDDEIGQGLVEVDRGDRVVQGWQEGAEVKYNGGSRSSGRRQLAYYVSLDTRGDFELFWDVDSVTETIQFRLVANVNKDDLLAFGFSAYGEPQDADFCVMWTDLHGRHLFQVNHPTASFWVS